MVEPTLSKAASATLISRLLELRQPGFRRAELTQDRVTRALRHGVLRKQPILIQVHANGGAVCPRLESPYAILSYWPEN